MRIWMEEQAGERDHFAAKITLAFAGLVAAVIALPCGIVVLALILMLFQMQKAKTKMKKDHILERYLRQRPSLTGVETQILSMERMQPAGDGLRVRCLVEYPNKKQGKRSYLLVSGYENEGELVAAFERRLRGAVM